MNETSSCSDKWDEFYKDKRKNLRFPDEDLVRLFLGAYLPTLPKKGRILDHGFGSGNNLVFLALQGYDCCGVEVSQTAIDVARDMFKSINCQNFDLKLFDGLHIPYGDEEFDIIYSWNAIHYNGTRAKVEYEIKEFHRLLKPGGHLLISTVSPESSVIASRGRKVSDDSYELSAGKFDNREGLIFFCLPRLEDWKVMLKGFTKIELGYQKTMLFLPDKIHASYLMHAIKNK